MHVLRFTLCETKAWKKSSSTVPIVSSTTTAMNGRSRCLIITVYSGNCFTLDSWTEFVLTSTKTEKAHLKPTLLQIPPRVSPTLKNVSVTVCYLFFRPEVKKIITWACFPARLFKIPYFSVRSSRSSALRYGWPSAHSSFQGVIITPLVG